MPTFNSEITNHYPDRIRQDKYKNHSVNILVKKQDLIKPALTFIKDKASAAYDIITGDWAYQLGLTDITPETHQSRISNRMQRLASTGYTIYGVTFPLPNELTDSQGHQWTVKNGIIHDLINPFEEKEIAGIKIGKALASFSTSTGLRKPLANPGYYQDYEGTQPREFSFVWDLIPESEEESRQIKNIIYHFKKFTLPSSSGMLMLSPYTFEIQIGNERIRDILNIASVVCSSMQISYGEDGGMQMFDDGTPKYMKLSMTFIERETITAEVY